MEREKCLTEPLLPDTFAKEPDIRVKPSWTLLTASAYQLNTAEQLLLGVVWNRTEPWADQLEQSPNS